MAQKEPRETAPNSVPEASDPAATQRRQFASWVQGVQQKARVPSTANMIAPSSPVASTPPRPPSSTPPRAPSSTPPRAPSSTPPRAPSSAPRPLAATPLRPPPPALLHPPASAPIASPSPVAPGSSPYPSLFREELPADELTAVFAPPAELLARSGRQPIPGSWEEPTQVVHVDDVLGTRATAPSYPSPAAGPTLEQLHFERKLAELATPVPAPQRPTRWLLWAFAAMMTGAAIAAIAEYSFHPTRPHQPSPTGLEVDPR